MLHAFGFGRVGVAVADLYFVNPDPEVGQEGPERGVRLEVRLLERGELKGGIYSAQPIAVGRPVWRADLLESVAGTPGSLDRAHHHPAFRRWEPGKRVFDAALTEDPLGFVAERLSDLPGLLAGAGIPATEVAPDDADDLRRAVPEIVDVVRRMLEGVKSGELARPAGGVGSETSRAGWL